MAKGQVETIVMTIIFLIIAVAVTLFAIFSLIAANATQLSLSVEVLGGTSNPINFASGALNDFTLQQGIQAVAYGDENQARDVSRTIQAFLFPFEIDKYSLLFRNQDQAIVSINNIPKFCGARSDNKFAYCHRLSDGCPIASSEFAQGQASCSADEICCVENFNIETNSYENVPSHLECTVQEVIVATGGPGATFVDVGKGVCQPGCSTGRTPTGGCGNDLLCCVPTRESASLTAATDSVTIPIIYRQTPNNPQGTWGSLEIAISTPELVQ